MRKNAFGFIYCAVALAVAAVVSTAAPVRADTRPDLVVAVNKLPRGLEPGEWHGNVDVRVTYSIFDTLIRRNFKSSEDGKPDLEPLLAESWKRLSPTELEVTLRKGVKFHNGEELTAEDVAFTFSPERLTGGKEAAIPGGRQYFGHLKEVQIIDKYTVRFVTKEPDIVLEQRLATYTAWIVSKKQWMEYKSDDPAWMRSALQEIVRKPIGTGPLKFKDWRKDQYVAFTANDDYFLGKPNFKSLTFKEVPELAGRIAGLVSGEFHIITDVTPDQFPVLERYKDIDVRSVVLENTHILTFNTHAPALKDKRLRQALSLAIDRDKLRSSLWHGQNYTPNGYQLKSYGSMYDPKRKGYVYDLEKAKRLVKESGYDGKAISFRLVPNYYLNGLEAAQVLQEMWKAAGINVRLDLVDNFNQVRADGVEIHAHSNTHRLPDPSTFVILWGPQSAIQRRYNMWNAPEAFNKLSEDLLASTDLEKRHRTFQQMLDIFEDEMPMTILYNPLHSYGVKKNIEWTPYPILYMDFRPDILRIKG